MLKTLFVLRSVSETDCRYFSLSRRLASTMCWPTERTGNSRQTSDQHICDCMPCPHTGFGMLTLSSGHETLTFVVRVLASRTTLQARSANPFDVLANALKACSRKPRMRTLQRCRPPGTSQSRDDIVGRFPCQHSPSLLAIKQAHYDHYRLGHMFEFPWE